MTSLKKTAEEPSVVVDLLQTEIADLRRQLEEANETITAIRSGAVDAFVVNEPAGQRVYTLQGAERPYRLLIEQLQQGAATLHADGTIAYCNLGLAELLKVPHEKLVGAPLGAFIAADDRSTFENLLRQDQSRSARGEVSICRANGELVPTYVTFSALPNDCGAEIAVLMTDLSTQKHHEQLTAAHDALKDSQDQLRGELADTELLQRLSATMMRPGNVETLYASLMDAAVSIMHADHATMQMLYPERSSGGELRLLAYKGFSTEAAKFWEWVSADSGCTCGEALRTGQRAIAQDVETCDFMAGTADRTEYLRSGILAAQSTPLFSRDGKLLGMLSTHWKRPHMPSVRDLRLLDIVARQAADLIERKLADDALRESEDRYRMLFRSMDEGFCTVEVLFDEQQCPTGYRFLEVNDAFEALTSIHEANGRLMRGIAPAHEQHWFDIYAKIALTGKPARFEASAKELNRWYDVYAFRIGLPERHQVAVLFNDISERRRIEQDLRTADRLKDEFLATLAHELRGPLAPIRNMLELMKQAKGQMELIEQARVTMDRQVSQMTRLIDDLLDVSRVSRGRIDLKREKVELASVVAQAVEACRPLADSAEHEVHVKLPANQVFLHADPVRLTQVLSNLLNNSCKYSDPGGIIWLTAEQQAGTAIIKVKDTGLGIPSDQLDSIFGMFNQVDRTLERSQGGLGIGLTLVKRLVEMHDGTVEAFSEGVGRGSEFVLRLPLLVESLERAHPASSRREARRNSTARRILIVDDSRDSAESLAMLLKLTGHETRMAHDGLEALDVAESFRPELVLLDIGLPKMNGHEVARSLRKQPWGKNILLVAQTGWGQDEDREKSNAAGFDAHLVKPVEYDSLQELLERM